MMCPPNATNPAHAPCPRCCPLATYDTHELVRRVKSKGEITWRNRFFYIGTAFRDLQVAIRPTATTDCFRVCYGAISLGIIDLSAPPSRPRGHYEPLKPCSLKL